MVASLRISPPMRRPLRSSLRELPLPNSALSGGRSVFREVQHDRIPVGVVVGGGESRAIGRSVCRPLVSGRCWLPVGASWPAVARPDGSSGP